MTFRGIAGPLAKRTEKCHYSHGWFVTCIKAHHEVEMFHLFGATLGELRDNSCPFCGVDISRRPKGRKK